MPRRPISLIHRPASRVIDNVMACSPRWYAVTSLTPKLPTTDRASKHVPSSNRPIPFARRTRPESEPSYQRMKNKTARLTSTPLLTKHPSQKITRLTPPSRRSRAVRLLVRTRRSERHSRIPLLQRSSAVSIDGARIMPAEGGLVVSNVSAVAAAAAVVRSRRPR